MSSYNMDTETGTPGRDSNGAVMPPRRSPTSSAAATPIGVPRRSPSSSQNVVHAWENPEMSIFAPAVPPPHQQDPFEGQSICLDDASDVSTLSATDGLVSLHSSVLDPTPKKEQGTIQPVSTASSEDEESPSSHSAFHSESRSSAQMILMKEEKGVMGWWRNVPKWARYVILLLLFLLITIIVIVAVMITSGERGSNDGSTASSNNGAEINGTDTDTPTMAPTTGEVSSGTSQPTSPGNNSVNPPPTPFPSRQFVVETAEPTLRPITGEPTTTAPTTPSATESPTERPTIEETQATTNSPSTGAPIAPTPFPTDDPNASYSSLIYIMGHPLQQLADAMNLANELASVPSEVDFIMNLGDFTAPGGDCSRQRFEDYQAQLQQSSVPLLVLPGENEWNSCPDPQQAWQDWSDVFGASNPQNWAPLDIQSQQELHVEHNFAFSHKFILHIGINLVGGLVQDEDEWQSRLQANFEWIISQVRNSKDIALVMIYGNSGFEGENYRLQDFYVALAERLQQELGPRGMSAIFVYESQDVGSFELVPQDDALIFLRFKGGNWPPLKVFLQTTIDTWDLSFEF